MEPPNQFGSGAGQVLTGEVAVHAGGQDHGQLEHTLAASAQLSGSGGRSVWSLDKHARPQAVGGENLYFHGRYFDMNGDQARAAARHLLERFRLADRADAAVDGLSGGMARRLMLARAFLHGPAVLFLDEPRAGLDPQSRRALGPDRSDPPGRPNRAPHHHFMEEADRLCDRVGHHGPRPHPGLRPAYRPEALARGEADLGGVAVTDLSVAEPTLETVFLNLTARS
jgi:ABC transporter